MNLDFTRYKSDRDILDATVNALRLQGCPARDAGGMCVYRTDGGAKCALGLWIPDSLYLPELEENDMYNLLWVMPEAWTRQGISPAMRSYAKGFHEWMARHAPLLSDLQDLHDECFKVVEEVEDRDSFERQVAFLRGKYRA